jgi:glycosyltransferase involved in cell wall biosynthesis
VQTTSRRILAVAPVSEPGGAETTLLRLLRGLAGRGWEVTLTAPTSGSLSSEATRRGLGFAELALGGLHDGQGARAILSWPRARRLARSADVVYLNGAVCGRLLPALGARGRRVVLHIHDMVERVPRFWRRADLVLAASEAVAARLRGLDPLVVYPPVDLDPPAAEPPWHASSGPVIGFVGRVERRKGPLDLVRAAPAIRHGAPGARVVVIGGNPYRTALDYTRAVLESPEVEHHPWSPNAPGLMRHLDVLVLPSYEEPAGTVLTEAMAVGTPVVASAVDGLPEIVRDGVTGRLVPPGDPDALASAVLEVLQRRREMGAAAREHARRFRSEEYVRQIEELLRG